MNPRPPVLELDAPSVAVRRAAQQPASCNAFERVRLPSSATL